MGNLFRMSERVWQEDWRLVRLIKYMGIYFASAFLPMMFVFTATFTNSATISYNGLAVDNEGNAYIGKACEIYIVDPLGAPLGTIEIPSERGAFRFFITEENQLRLRASGYVYTMDLQGNIIKQQKPVKELLAEFPANPQRKAIASDGKVYTMKMPFLRTVVQVQEGETVSTIYEMPLYDYSVRLVFFLLAISWVIFIPVTI